MTRGVVGLLLAAGFARRFGADKRWQPLPDGMPLALASAARLRAACNEVLVVVRPEDEALARALRALDCAVVFNTEAAAGLGRSLATGVRASADAAGWLVALADMPGIAVHSHRAVLDRLAGGAAIAVAEYHGQRGHPVGFDRRWYADLAALDGDQGARSVLLAHAGLVERVAVDDPGILTDVDRPQDLAALTVDGRGGLEIGGGPGMST